MSPMDKLSENMLPYDPPRQLVVRYVMLSGRLIVVNCRVGGGVVRGIVTPHIAMVGLISLPGRVTTSRDVTCGHRQLLSIIRLTSANGSVSVKDCSNENSTHSVPYNRTPFNSVCWAKLVLPLVYANKR